MKWHELSNYDSSSLYLKSAGEALVLPQGNRFGKTTSSPQLFGKTPLRPSSLTGPSPNHDYVARLLSEVLVGTT